jgi:hypothetical protein
MRASILSMRSKLEFGEPSKRSRRSWVSNRSARSIRSSIFSRESIYMVGARAKKRPKKAQIFNIVRRLVGIAAAIQYVYISMMATWRTAQVLRATHNPPQSFQVFTASLIGSYVGDGLLRDSPLVQDVLGGDTSPRDYALFLESETQTSTQNCSGLPAFDAAIYNYEFLSRGFMEMVNDTKYSITELDDFELVLVVVDCSFTPIATGDASIVRVFNLLRPLVDPTGLILVTVSLSVQDYEVRDHSKYGPALLAMLSLVQDVSADTMTQFYLVAPTYPYQRGLNFEVYEFVGTTDESFLELRSIPQEPLTQPVKHLLTARKRGFVDGNDQSNIRYMYSTLDPTARSSLSRWEWFGEAVTVDSWAWVHGLHFFFGMETIFSLLVLCLVSYQNLLAGRVWVGDPFASVSTATLALRGVLVALSWYLDSFWAMFEFCLSNASILSGNDIIHVEKELVHADVLVAYLGLVAFLSSKIRERIDPAIAIFLFEIIHSHRLSFVRSSPAVLREVESYSDGVFRLGDAEVAPVVDAMSPLDFRSTFQIPAKDGTFLAASFFPKITLLAIILSYAILRKVYHHYLPDSVRHRSSLSSSSEKAQLTAKSQLTNFETSTGAELHTRYGIITDYKNYVYFKGMKFASADGVYCSGYVIVNGKMLVAMRDLISIVSIKAVGSRFTNVYAYEVYGNAVKDTARLVYPDTFTWQDLWRLNVTVLL